MSDHASLAPDARMKPNATDRWGFLPGAKCACGRPLGYQEKNLKRERNVPVMTVEGKQVVAAYAYVCRCGAAYTRGKNISERQA